MEMVIIITYLIIGGSLPLLWGFIFAKVYDDFTVFPYFWFATIFVIGLALVQIMGVYYGNGHFIGFAVIAPSFISILNGVFLSAILWSSCYLLRYFRGLPQSTIGLLFNISILAICTILLSWKGLSLYFWPWNSM